MVTAETNTITVSDYTGTVLELCWIPKSETLKKRTNNKYSLTFSYRLNHGILNKPFSVLLDGRG
jgi:hypothetical protein